MAGRSRPASGRSTWPIFRFVPIFILGLLAACEPNDLPLIDTAPTVTRIPFFASDTPSPSIVPVTEPSSPTPGLPPEITETPARPLPSVGWWEVYFTDPLTLKDPAVIAGSVEEKLIQFI